MVFEKYLPLTYWAGVTIICLFIINLLINKIEDRQEKIKLVIQAVIMLATISVALFIYYLGILTG